MAMELRIVCPESCAYEGSAAFVALPGTTGEIGVLPGHASEISTLKPGYVRVSEQAMGTVDKAIAVTEGYAEITADRVIILAERAQDVADIDDAKVQAQLEEFEGQLSMCSEGDARRAYLYNEIAWCRLLLDHRSA